MCVPPVIGGITLGTAAFFAGINRRAQAHILVVATKITSIKQ